MVRFASNILIVSLFITVIQCLPPDKELFDNVGQINYNSMSYTNVYKCMSELLNRQNWLRLIAQPEAITNVSNKCIESFRRFNTSISGRPEDIIYLLDSFSKPQPGILTGNMQWLGNWDECNNLHNTRYITLSIPLSISGLVSQMVQIDICLPVECDNDTDIRGLLSVLSVIGIDADKVGIFSHLPHELTVGRYAVIILLCVFGVLILISTVVDFIERAVYGLNNLFRKEYSRRSVSQIPSYNYHTGNTDDDDLRLKGSTLNRVESDLTDNNEANEYSKLLRSETYSRSISKQAATIIHRLIVPFSLYTNVKKVFDTNQPPNAIRCLNGIRTISMFWVILGHVYLFTLSSETNTMDIITDIALRFSFQPVLNGYFSVDTFFVLSGLLVMYLSLRELNRSSKKIRSYIIFLVKFYIHRILRITPTLFVVLVAFWQLTPIITDGPLWRPGIDTTVGNCDGFNWITPLLYLNNLYPSFKNGCMAWTWYLANDMQFFFISPIFIFPAFLLPFPFPLIPLAVAIFIFLIPSFVIPGVFSLHSNFYFPLNHLTDGLFPIASNMTHGDITEYFYIKPYCRINPYLMGLALGYIIYKVSEWKRESGDKKSLQLRMALINTIFWPVSFAICFGLVYGLYGSFHGHLMSDFENILYIGLSRTLWGLGLSMFIFICYSGMAGPIDTFLSWGLFVPLSRLTFSAYLIHPVVLLVFSLSLRDKLYYYDITFSFIVVGLITMSYAAAAIIAICIEFPLSNVEDLILKRKKSGRQTV
ncbi:Nose resistant to fluoxetine protein 6-like [Oopsacas minuta]|uniref:Nose resistant to fluoxetine protein 6-like n=1 Tax=Oopsacas minuta TaxID=111878 RepID=A0AAV7JX66_9METZ|nr:Nose resistant to fluoxetine protein 6-like [Oopsacas minuta]